MIAHITREITFSPTPEEMAEVFTNWNSEYQALFLDKVAERMNLWSPHARLLQCTYIRNDLTRYFGTRFDAVELIEELREDPT